MNSKSDTIDTEKLIEKLENIPGVMVLLPTPGTSGRKKTLVRIPLYKLQALLLRERLNELNYMIEDMNVQQDSWEWEHFADRKDELGAELSRLSGDSHE